MPRRKLTMGKGATASCLSKHLHPSQAIRDAYTNPEANHRLENLTVLRMEEKKINRRKQLAIVTTHDEFVDKEGKNIELYAARKWVVVTKEGPEDLFFDGGKVQEGEEPEEPSELPTDLQNVVERGTKIDTEILSTLTGKVPVDDDNLPAPENLPTETPHNEVMREWGQQSICHRLCTGAVNMPPRLNQFPRDAKPDLVALFLILFPKEFVINTVLVETNKNLSTPLKLGEFLRWCGMWFLMATTYTTNRRDFWATKNVSAFDGALFRLNEVMSRKRFEDILKAFRLTSIAPPTYRDPFYEVRQILHAWNCNMREVFTPGWISCLDESMSKWVSKYSCPGFMVVPRKPWPLGNEYHTIACGVCGVLYALELVEGKDTPPQRPQKEFTELGKTVGLLLRLTKVLWGTSKIVVLDSGFCVLKGIVELRKRGVFASALIKKRRYWPRYIPGDQIREHFQEMEVGTVDCWAGELDSVLFSIHAMKEPDYVMSLMSSYGTTQRFGEEQSRILTGGRRVTFKYPEVIYNHFRYRDSVDAHNSARMFPIALEETWKTTRWPLRVFQFLLAVTEVNVWRTKEYMFPDGEETEETQCTQQSFRKELAYHLIFNSMLEEEQQSPRRSKRRKGNNENSHELVSLEPFKNFCGTKIIKTKTRCTQRKCLCKTRRVNTYCKCTPGMFLCSQCFVDHVSAAIEES